MFASKVKATFHYAILVTDMVCDCSQTCSELKFGLSSIR